MARLTTPLHRASGVLAVLLASVLATSACDAASDTGTPIATKPTVAVSGPLGGANGGPQAPGLPTTVPDESPYEQVLPLATDTSGAAGTLFAFWNATFPKAFPQAPKQFTPITFAPYQPQDQPPSACGKNYKPGDMRENAFYCPTDDSVSYDDVWLRKLHAAGDFAPVVILYHEYGHRIEQLAGIRAEYEIQREQRADCFAGLATAYTAASGLLNSDDIREGVKAVYDLGTNGGKWWSTDAHSTPDQRQVAFMAGYAGNVQSCIDVGNQSPGSALTAGGYTIFVSNGTTADPKPGGAYTLKSPQETASADVQSLSGKLQCTADPVACLNQAWTIWFQGSKEVTALGGLNELTLMSKAGQPVSIPLTKVQPKGMGIANNTYRQVFNDGTVLHGMFVVVQGSDGEPLVLDVYLPGEPTQDWTAINSYVVSLLTGLSKG